MDYVIYNWKADPETNHVYASGNRVLLSPFFSPVKFQPTVHAYTFLSGFIILFQYVLGMDNMTKTNKFSLVVAFATFHRIMKPQENLLKAKLVSHFYVLVLFMYSISYFYFFVSYTSIRLVQSNYIHIQFFFVFLLHLCIVFILFNQFCALLSYQIFIAYCKKSLMHRQIIIMFYMCSTDIVIRLMCWTRMNGLLEARAKSLGASSTKLISRRLIVG